MSNNINICESNAIEQCASFNPQNLDYLSKILTYDNKSVRIIGSNEDPWFCGRDVCGILEYANYGDAI